MKYIINETNSLTYKVYMDLINCDMSLINQIINLYPINIFNTIFVTGIFQTDMTK